MGIFHYRDKGLSLLWFINCYFKTLLIILKNYVIFFASIYFTDLAGFFMVRMRKPVEYKMKQAIRH